MKLLQICLLFSYFSAYKAVTLKLAYNYYLKGAEAMHKLQNHKAALEFFILADKHMSPNEKFDYSGMYNDLGILYAEVGNVAMASNSFERALSLNPFFLPALGNHASLKTKLGDFEGAEKIYQQAIMLPNVSPEIFHNYGVHSMPKNETRAMEMFHQAIQLNPNMYVTRGDYASCLCSGGQMLASQQQYEIALKAAEASSDHYWFWNLKFQSMVGVISTVPLSHAISTKERYSFLRNMVGLLALSPPQAMPDPEVSLGCSSLGYFLMYQGLSDIIPRQLLAVTYAHMSLLGYVAPHLLLANTNSNTKLDAPGPSFGSSEMIRLFSEIISRELLVDEQGGGTAIAGEEEGTESGREEAEAVEEGRGEDSHGAAEKIRVGFLSAYFYHHSVGLLMQGVICNLNRDNFQVTVIAVSSANGRQDYLTERIKQQMHSDDMYLALEGPLNDQHVAIGNLKLDILVFGEIGMNPTTLARVSMVFWGHAVTSGVVGFSEEEVARGGPDYYISSRIFERENLTEAQHKYSERLILQEGLTTHFMTPKHPLSASELGLPSGTSGKGRERMPTVAAIDVPSKHEYLKFLVGADNWNALLTHMQLTEGPQCHLCASSMRVYGVPQTAYKLSPDFVLLLKTILTKDPLGIVVLTGAKLKHSSAVGLQNIASVLGADLARRFISLRNLNEREYITLCAVFDVALDTFPVGGGRSSFEIFSTGTPIVVQYSKTSILQLTYGMYQVMGINSCITHSDDEYVELSLQIASQEEMQREMRSLILARNTNLYENASVLSEWEAMLTYVHLSPRPSPQLSLLRSGGDDVTVVQDGITTYPQQSDTIKQGLRLTYDEPALLLSDFHQSPLKVDYVSNDTEAGHKSAFSQTYQDCRAREVSPEDVDAAGVSLAFVFGEESMETIKGEISHAEKSLGQCLPGGSVLEVLVVFRREVMGAAEKASIFSQEFPHFTVILKDCSSARNPGHDDPALRLLLKASSAEYLVLAKR